MAALGTVTVRDPQPPLATLIPISAYQVERGNFLGTIGIHDAAMFPTGYVDTVADYIVRQTSIVYRQLWPYHGQRFPQ